MSSKYFFNFPTIKYDGKIIRNIILKSIIVENVIKSRSIFYPYTIKDGERPDTIAYDYYGNSDYYWVIHLCNNIIDPYYQWPLTQEDLDKFIVSKYESITNAMQTIAYYEYNEFNIDNDEESEYKKTYKMSADTYESLSIEDKSYWTSVSAYDYEFNLNEERRNIKLLSVNYLPQIENEISRIFR